MAGMTPIPTGVRPFKGRTWLPRTSVFLAAFLFFELVEAVRGLEVLPVLLRLP